MMRTGSDITPEPSGGQPRKCVHGREGSWLVIFTYAMAAVYEYIDIDRLLRINSQMKRAVGSLFVFQLAIVLLVALIDWLL
jgi:hypothetical protein